MSIIRTHEKNWEAVPRAPFDDPRLSLPSKGCLAWLLTRRAGWEVRVEAMRDWLKITEWTWQKIISKELEAAGYLTKKRVRGKQGKFEWVFTVFSETTIPCPTKDGEPQFYIKPNINTTDEVMLASFRRKSRARASKRDAEVKTLTEKVALLENEVFT